MSGILKSFFLLVTIWPCVYQSVSDGSEIQLRIPDTAIERIARRVAPVTVNGVMSAGVGPLRQELTYTAVVNAPKIRLTRTHQSFEANADIQLQNGLTLNNVPVQGELDIHASNDRQSLEISLKSASLPIRLPFIAVNVDVSRDITIFPIRIALPNFELGIGEKNLLMTPATKIEHRDGELLIHIDLDLEERGAIREQTN